MFDRRAAVGRPLTCVPRSVWQGGSGPSIRRIDAAARTTRRNSFSIPTSCNAARRCAGRAPGVVAAFSLRVSTHRAQTLSQHRGIRFSRSGQLPFPGVTPCGDWRGGIAQRSGRGLDKPRVWMSRPRQGRGRGPMPKAANGSRSRGSKAIERSAAILSRAGQWLSSPDTLPCRPTKRRPPVGD
jgi:hypothetical protein